MREDEREKEEKEDARRGKWIKAHVNGLESGKEKDSKEIGSDLTRSGLTAFESQKRSASFNFYSFKNCHLSVQIEPANLKLYV